MERPLLDSPKRPVATREEIFALPKCELHCHLDGSIRLSTLMELAKTYDIDLPCSDEKALAELLHIGRPCKDLDEYLKAFDHTVKVLQHRDALERVAYELAEDAAHENTRYLELRYSPIWHATQGLTWTETVDAVLAGLNRAQSDFGIHTGVILTGIRSIDPKVSCKLAELAVAYKGKGVVGFDLAGSEEHNPPNEHIEAFYVIKNNNVNCTLHAGEEKGGESISQALHHCGADRIGQGTHLVEGADLLNYCVDHRIPMEICLSSAVQSGAIDTISHHPFGFYYDFGLRVTLNTDNRLLCQTSLTNELFLAAQAFELSIEDVKDIIINGFKSAFLPFREKVHMLETVLPELGRDIPVAHSSRV